MGLKDPKQGHKRIDTDQLLNRHQREFVELNPQKKGDDYLDTHLIPYVSVNGGQEFRGNLNELSREPSWGPSTYQRVSQSLHTSTLIVYLIKTPLHLRYFFLL